MPPAAKRGNPTTDPGILLKRKKDRQKANEKLQLRLDEQGVKRTDIENNLLFSSIPQVLLINQKNYYTEYLKKDDNYRIIRNMREKINNNINNNDINNNSSNNKKSLNNTGKSKKTNNYDNNDMDIDDDNDEVDADDERNNGDGEKTLVIHPGSHGIKIGWADDVDPVLVPNLIGYIKMNDIMNSIENDNVNKSDIENLDPPRHLVETSVEEDEESEKYIVLDDDLEFNANRKPIKSSFKERMKYYKRRLLPNCHDACFKFNIKQQIQGPTIEDISEDVSLNSSHQNKFIKAKEWIKLTGRNYVIGDEVMRLDNENEWIIRSPFLFSSVGSLSTSNKISSVELGFNEQDINYSSTEEILGDIELILCHTILNKFNINRRSDFKKINVVLVIPSLYRKSYVESMMEILLKRLNFKNATLIQEGMSASFGLGLSTGCIVDIGSSSIHICCIDDGSILEDTRVSLDYGMSDVIRFWGKSLIQQQFPYTKVNFENLKDWKLIEGTFADHGTFDDSKIVIQLGNAPLYENNNKIKKYQFKCFDEGIICPMGMFYPEIFNEESNKLIIDNKDKQKNRILLGKISPIKKIHDPLFEGKSNKFTGYSNIDPISILQDLQRTDVKISELKIEELLELLVELSELFINSNTIGSGRRGKTNDISSKLKSRYRNAHYAQQRKQGEIERNIKENKELTTNSMRQNMTPLDRAIIESITVSGLNDQSKIEKMYSNICLVGGGGRLEGFDSMLMDRLHINRNEILGSSKLIEAINLIKSWKREFDREQKIRIKEKQEKEKILEKEERERLDKEVGKDKDSSTKNKIGDGDGDDDNDNGGADDDDVSDHEGEEKSSDENESFSLNKEQIQEIITLLSEGTSMNIDITGKGDVDPVNLGWKGGCIYARLKIIDEMWMNGADWDILGSRALTYGSLFNY
ncbi:actin-like protein arp8 [Pichia californica]|uniref:Actin-like protein arp8 n=1 Tax=Pichia californica TaxID=460514 RepID=A0A9P7BIH3_9ASCO|nr:actin-like protein arp8 [[Candida] californica]